MKDLSNHVRNVSKYMVEGKSGTWIIVYYPIFSNGYKGEEYDEARALIQNLDKPGFWHNEMPLRYLTEIK